MTWITVSFGRPCYGGLVKHPTPWREKLNVSHDLPRVERIPQRMIPVWGSGTILIPAPREV